MAMDRDMKSFAFLILGLFVIMLIVAIVFIGESELNSVICTQAGPTGTNAWTYVNGDCVNVSGTAQTVTAITQVKVVSALVVLALGLLSLIVIVLLFKVIIRVAKGFGSDK